MKALTCINVAFAVVNVLCVILFAHGDILEAKFESWKENADYHFPSGSRIQLYCVQDTSYGIVIKNSSNSRVNIVQDSKLQEQFSDKYLFEVINSTTGLFTIKELTTEFNFTQFQCENQRLMTATFFVFNRINNSDLICSSSYRSRYIFEDLLTSHIEFNCTSEEGDPPVGMSAYIRHRGEINDVTINSSIIESSHPYLSKTLLFSSNLTSSLNNSVFVCNVSQQLPGQSQSDSYQGSCSFGPLLLLPSFSVSVIPSNITVNESDDVILTCISNVSKVIFDWSNIPSDWEINIKRGNDFSELHITDYGSSVTSVILECVVTYGDRTIRERVDISVVRRQEPAGAIIALICVFLIITITAVICLLVYTYRNNTTKCLENITGKHIFGKNNSSKNNSNEDNNISNTNEKLRRVDDVSSSLGGGTLMIDNTIYESSNVDKRKDDIEMTSTKSNQIMDQDCQMVENSIYESTSLNVEKQQSCVNPEYDTLQPDVHHI